MPTPADLENVAAIERQLQTKGDPAATGRQRMAMEQQMRKL